jgi:hypothetical protein
LLVYAPLANALGSPYDSFTFQVRDNGGTDNGGADTDPAARTITINVLGTVIVNHAPVGTPATATTLENVAYVIPTADFGFTDPNDSPANNLLSVKIATLPGAGTLTDNGTNVTAGQYVSASDIAGGKLVFTPAANASGTAYANLTFQVRDDGGTLSGGVDLDDTARTLTFNVTHVNQAPAGSSNTVTTRQNASYTFLPSDFILTDPHDSPANVLAAVKITTLPTAGTLTDNGAAVTAGQFVPASDIASGKLVFTPDAGASGTPYGSFTFQVQDDGGTDNGGVNTDPTARTMTVNVVFVNHAPTGASNTISVQANSDYRFSAANFGFSDPDDVPANGFNGVVIASLPASGTLWTMDQRGDVSSVTVGEFISNSQIIRDEKGFFFTPAAGGGSTSFTFQVQDTGGTLNGGVNTDPTPKAMTLTVPSVNHAPVGTPTTVTTLENVAYTLQAGDFGFTDPDDSPTNSLLAVKLTTLPTAGTLTDNGTAVTAGQFVTVADITWGNLVFTPAADGSGAGYASLTFQVEDDGGTANGGIDFDATARTLTFDVTHVNQAPAGTSGSVTLWQGTSYAFQGSDFGFTDPHDSPANALAGVVIGTLPAVGAMTDNGTAVTAGQFVSAGDIAAGELVYAPAGSDTGSPYASFTFQVEDDGGTASGGANLDPAARTMTVNVSPLVAPLLTGPGTLNYAAHDLPRAIAPAIVVTSPSSPTLASATIAITNFVAADDVLGFANDGSTMGNIAGLFDNTTGVLTLTSSGETATIAQWQAALRTVTYFNQSAFPDTTTRGVTFTVDDGQSTNPVSNTLTSTVQIGSLASPPAITGLSVDTGATSGGTSVTITGAGFDNVSSVLFGAALATSFTVNSPTSITAVAPAGHAGAVDVIVVALAGSSSITQNDRFTYQDPVGLPTVTSVTPGTASASGGDTITIRGTDFSAVTAVTFGGTAAASFTVTSPTTIAAVAPAHLMGQVDLQVTTDVGTSATGFADRLVFVAPVSLPSVTGLTSSSGDTAGGVYVNVLGSNFANVSAVTFGNVDATWFTVNSASSITALVPAEFAGTVDVTVTNSAGTSATSTVDRYTYESRAPVVSSLSTTLGSVDGGTAVMVHGGNFEGVSAVRFGDLPATRFSVIDAGTILAVAPAGTIGTVDITVESINGTSPTTLADQFSYIAPPPAVTGLGVSSGLTTGGASVTISGTNLAGATGVYFGSVAAAAFYANPDGTLTAITPAQALGTVDVTVANASGTSSASTAGQFTFTNPPAIVTDLSVATGSHEGGTAVTITGSRFLGATAVYFGDARAPSFTVSGDGTITAIAPAEALGTVDVTIVNASGTSATSSADLFTFDASDPPGGSTGTDPGTATDLPTVIDLDSGSGAIAGGQSVTIYGYNLTGATAVLFGTAAAASFVVNSDSSITAVAPAAAAGTVAITVVSPAGTSTAAPAGEYVFYDPSALPGVSGITFSSDSTAVGDLVTIEGADFHGVTDVSFGGVSTVFYVESPTEISALIPAGITGPVTVTVTNDNGPSAATPASTVWIGGASAGGGTAGPVPGSGSSSLPAGLDLVIDPATGFPAFSGFGTDSFNSFFSALFGTNGSSGSGGSGTPSGGGVGFVDALPTPGVVAAPWLSNFDPNSSTALPIAAGVWTNHDQPGMVGVHQHTDTDAGFSEHDHAAGTDTWSDSVSIPFADGSVLTATISQTITETTSYIAYGHLDQHDHEILDFSQSTLGWTLRQTFHYSLVMPNGSGFDNTWQSSRTKSLISTVSGNVTTMVSHIKDTAKLASHDVAGTGWLTGNQDSLAWESDTSDGVVVASTAAVPYQKSTSHYSQTGGDNYSQKSALAGATAGVTGATLDTLQGKDQWSTTTDIQSDDEQSGQTSTGMIRTTNTGNDQYATLGQSLIDTTTPEGGGTVVLHETDNTTDSGTDQYSATSNTTNHTYIPGGQLVGTVTTFTTRDDQFSGKEKTTKSDNGRETSNYTDSSGNAVNLTDDFNDFVADTFIYSLGDDENENSNSGGVDDIQLADDDQEKFSTGDLINGTITAINAYGTATVAAIADNFSDLGTLAAGLTLEDDETLGPAEEDLEDDIEFDEPLKEQDTAKDQLVVGITTRGQVGPGEFVDSTETLTATGESPSSEGYDDAGEDDALPGGDRDTEKITDTFRTGDTLAIEDVLHSTDTTTLADGTVSKITTNDDDTDQITDSETDTQEEDLDTNTAAGETNDDDETADDEFTFEDAFAQDDKTSLLVTMPVTGGILTFGYEDDLTDGGTEEDTESDIGEEDVDQPAADHETDETDESEEDAGDDKFDDWLNFTATDPSGAVTTINITDESEDNFSEEESDDVTDATQYGSAASDVEHEMHDRTDHKTGEGHEKITILGNIGNGETVDFEEEFTVNGTEDDADDETDDATAPGNDVIHNEVSSNYHDSITGGGHATTSFVYTTDDGQGNTSSINETDSLTESIDDEFADGDDHESEIVDVNAQVSSDSESDTDEQDATLHRDTVETTHAHDVFTSVNSVAGFVTTGTFDDDGSTDTIADDLSEGLKDVKSPSGTETVSGGFDDEESDVEADHVRVSVHYVGTDAQGRILDLTEAATQDDTVTDQESNDDQLAADGSDEDVADERKTADGTVTESLTGTITTINADGTKSTVTYNDTMTDGSDAHSDDGDTENTTAAGTTTDTPIHTIAGTAHFTWGINDTIVVTDAGGNVISSGADVDNGGSDGQIQKATTDATALYSATVYTAAAGQKTEPPGGYENSYWEGFKGFFGGLGTGVKALVNEGVKNIVKTASAGIIEVGDLIAVDPINDIGYESAARAARIGTGSALALATLGLSKVSYVGTTLRTLDQVGNLRQGVVGVIDAAQNGLNWQNGTQIVMGAVGVFSVGESIKGAVPKSIAGPTVASKMSSVRALGKQGETAAGIAKNTQRIVSLSGKAKYRIPDELTETAVKEVKNVAQLDFNAQIRDSLHFAIEEGKDFFLVVRESTYLSQSLKNAIQTGWINLRYLP